MKLSHLLNLVSELPKHAELNYVRGTDTCRFIDVDIPGERINSEAPNGEAKSWAPSYLADLAPKIRENVPFNLSGLLNNKGSFRPVLETIIAHTREFYTVKKGTATALVWIPSKPKIHLELEEINQDDIPAPVESDTIDVCMAIINPLKDSISREELITELKKMYASLGTAGVHLFGLKYGKFLVEMSVKELSEIAATAGISENFGAELNKLRNVYKVIHEHKFGVSFYDEIRVSPKDISSAENLQERDFSYLRAMRTKPFLLLAGISGTGKSRIVKQMAFDSCPDNSVLRSDLTSPGNYCLIEVKPNWHDSTELLGYESKIGGAHYQLTPFVKFLAKTMLYPETPFFVCLDEMNLAPVEQYFAEFLSVLESRTKIDGHIVSEPLIKADIFRKYNMEKALFSQEEDAVEYSAYTTIEPQPPYGKESEVYATLKEQGLRIPENVVVIGTVNMDETTHQFSRKVIDRAMTIEMNLPDGDPFMDFFANPSDLTYRSTPTSPSLYLATETRASDVVNALVADNAEKTEWLKGEVAAFLTNLNDALENTPFKVAYRVQNELMLYFYQLWLEKRDADWSEILRTSCDQILMMKVLPRVEGDEELLEKPVDELIKFCAPYPNASKKLSEMKTRLGQSRFTSYWP
ncbi:MAG: hypothetical protein K2G52_02985 [Muribaculaceae bacterium]|nr:hypothetical protein [Muribaculaceae bacterium]